MPHNAFITGHVTYTPGDGAPITIPQGRVEINLSDDSATLSWEAGEDTVGSAAIPLDSYERYLREGKIQWAK